MSSDAPSDTSDFEVPDVSNDNSRGIDLEPGDHITGTITAFKPWVGDNGLVEIDGQDIWLNRTLRDQLIAGLVEGSTVKYKKSSETESFDDDGETIEYHPRAFAFSGGED
jgi:hypothetical protein